MESDISKDRHLTCIDQGRTANYTSSVYSMAVSMVNTTMQTPIGHYTYTYAPFGACKTI